ncbi:hypothetical protein NKH86_06860 [Mesorhizobium sp. M0913]|uniref:hypothetical protein n=1 Tax=Mesorhizobium sp. M0913 TaxID=2957026 RepID=UPI003339E9FB
MAETYLTTRNRKVREMKFSIDPERLSARIVAAESANAASRAASEDEMEARQKLQALKSRVARDAERYRAGDRQDFIKASQAEIEKLEADIERLKAKKDQLTEKWQHLGAIRDRCEAYATPRRPGFFIRETIA